MLYADIIYERTPFVKHGYKQKAGHITGRLKAFHIFYKPIIAPKDRMACAKPTMISKATNVL
jgi:hypothetical protein